MSELLSRLVTSLAYATSQLPRLAWYSGHLYALQKLAKRARQLNGESTRSPPRPDPILDQRLNADMATLFKRDLENVLAGLYPANAMRRQALPPLAEVFANLDQRKLRLIDVGCGTGRFLDFFKQVWPRLPVLGLDLSDAYIRHARGHLKR